jgi:hypothetical protein
MLQSEPTPFNEHLSLHAYAVGDPIEFCHVRTPHRRCTILHRGPAGGNLHNGHFTGTQSARRSTRALFLPSPAPQMLTDFAAQPAPVAGVTIENGYLPTRR